VSREGGILVREGCRAHAEEAEPRDGPVGVGAAVVELLPDLGEVHGREDGVRDT
jgi:hypothetical protein